MEARAKLPVVRLELSAGTFRIKTEDAIYEISVTSDPGLTRVVETIIATERQAAGPSENVPGTDASAAHVPEAEDTFYKEISEDMFKEVGRLARELSLSIATPVSAPMTKVDIEKAGVDLENAKGLLEDVVRMTERATMNIMDISDNIHEHCEAIKQNLAAIKQLRFVGNTAADPGPSGKEDAVAGFVAGIVERLCSIRELIGQIPVPEGAPDQKQPQPEPAAARTETYAFDLDVVFQTLYELCTNETVKKSHLKPIREHQEELFDVGRVMQMFAEMAPDVQREENFFNFPLPSILKVLFQCTDDDKTKQVLKKMRQTADDLFLEQILPIAGTVEVKEVPAAPAAPSTAPQQLTAQHQAAFERIEDAAGFVRDQAEQLRHTAISENENEYSMIRREDHQRLIAALESTDAVIQKIISNITRILESLSFQDLSGQRIMKIVAVLTHVQIQLLGILVSFGVKLRKKEEDHSVKASETEALAMQEVDRIMKRFTEHPAEDEVPGEAALNQHEVDRLLAEFGF